MWDALKHESRMVGKPKTGVERRVAHEDTPIRCDLAQFGKTFLHERPPDPAALQDRLDRNRPKAIPASGIIADGDRRERNMPDDAARIFRNERN